jgi:acyl-CoA thioester hydrolase
MMHTYPILITYEDTDLSGFVYHANYLKYFDRARTDMLGLDQLREIVSEGRQFVVHKAMLTYRRPALFGDQLEVRSTCEMTGSPRAPFKQAIYRGDELLVEGEIHLAYVTKEGKPTRFTAK